MHPRSLVLPVCVSLLLLDPAPGRASESTNALKDYVQKPDSAFRWRLAEQKSVDQFTVSRLDCTSQRWREHEWTHQLLVVRPRKVLAPDIALLFITGDRDVQNEVNVLRTLAERAGAIAGIINHIPNQPLYDGREEDALIAFTFDQYLRTGDQSWPLLFPMVKSAVRGMDTVQAFAQTEYKQKVTRFLVTGASKRGWTTWLTAATDPRVVAAAPIVIDMLNMKAQTQWAEKMYGKQSDEVGDYTQLDLIKRIDDPRMVQLRRWVDPYSFRDTYKIPKLLLLGANDPYWVVDSLRHYWNDLPEPKFLFQTPNAGHDLAGGKEAIPVLAAFFESVARSRLWPTLSWKLDYPQPDLARLELRTGTRPKSVRLWTADSIDRDFRDETWFARELPAFHSKFAATVAAPANGFRAFMLEADFEPRNGAPYHLSTEARVVPDGPPRR